MSIQNISRLLDELELDITQGLLSEQNEVKTFRST